MNAVVSLLYDFVSALSLIDIVALLVMALSAFAGSRRGLSGELALLISLIAAIIMGVHIHGPLAGWCTRHTRLTGETSQALAVVATILVCVVIVLIISFLLRYILRITIEDRFDKFFGSIASIISTGAIIVIIFITMNVIGTDYLKRKFGKESLIGRQVVKFVPSFKKGMGPELEEGQLWKPRKLRQWDGK